MNTPVDQENLNLNLNMCLQWAHGDKLLGGSGKLGSLSILWLEGWNEVLSKKHSLLNQPLSPEITLCPDSEGLLKDLLDQNIEMAFETPDACLRASTAAFIFTSTSILWIQEVRGH